MLFGDEVVSPDSVDELGAVEDAPASDRELAMAKQLIDSLSADFDPAKYRDDYRDRVLAMIEAKAAGLQIAVAPETEDAPPAPDLMAALEASLAALAPAPAKPAKPAKAAGPVKPKPAKREPARAKS